MSRIVLGPFNRVEGDLEVTLDVAHGKVNAAYVNSPLFRGFERMLQGRDPMDALVLAPRICGICSVSQATAASLALADAMKIEVPPNGQYAANLILANENLADHITHFYLFFMPDFARDVYKGRPWFDAVRTRFKAMEGSAAREVVPARAAFLRLMGYLAGKWPHTLSIQPGGSVRAIGSAEKVRVFSILRQFRRFLEETLYGDSLESVVSLDSMKALEKWRENRSSGDFALFLDIAKDLGLQRYGRASDCFMSYGNYPLQGKRLFDSGLWQEGLLPLDTDAIIEDVSHSWMEGSALHPSMGMTEPVPQKENAYSWCKAPRLGGKVVETGALARQLVDGHPLLRDLAASTGGNVYSRVVARLVETARVQIAMEEWVGKIEPGAPFHRQGGLPHEASGAGLIEAARGSLGHWLHVHRGRILNYQIISPTTWNFSPRDENGIPGALEQALAGTPYLEGDALVQHIVRSFDPCMVCTVH